MLLLCNRKDDYSQPVTHLIPPNCTMLSSRWAFNNARRIALPADMASLQAVTLIDAPRSPFILSNGYLRRGKRGLWSVPLGLYKVSDP